MHGIVLGKPIEIPKVSDDDDDDDDFETKYCEVVICTECRTVHPCMRC